MTVPDGSAAIRSPCRPLEDDIADVMNGEILSLVKAELNQA